MRGKQLLVAIVAIILTGAVLVSAYTLGKKSASNSVSTNAQTQKDSSKYNLLAKRIFIDDPNDPKINFTPLRQQIQDYVSKNNLSGSIYFEYLPTGTSIRISGDSQEVAASLIKLPAAMELYKAVELGKVSLDDKVTLTNDMLDSAYGDLYTKGAGYTLTLKEAVQIMLEDSDNTALKAIATTIANKVPADQTPFNYVDIDISQNKDLSVSISARSYSSLLKCLYFSCYNTKDSSQEILKYLTKTKFNDRLMAGINNKNISVAHKVGNHTQDTQSDCGIVYEPKRNYILCVMIKGPDDATTNKKIAEVSKLAYDYVHNLPN